MKKSSSGMISFQTEKNEESLLVVAGYYVNSPGYKQPGEQYTNGKTNEIHIFNVTTSEYLIVSYFKHHILYFCVKMTHNNYILS